MKHLFSLKTLNKAFLISFCLLSSLPTAQPVSANQLNNSEGTLLARRSRSKKVSQPKYDEKYILEFNRSPIVGNRMRLRGVYSEGRLGFTRPQGWDVGTVKAAIRFQHSP
ncbi:MAG: cellulose biosynthesis cyclic di-GMP-binding regulatory protein BcsB, partial [Cyanobacteria bacterium J06629_18]